MEKEFVPYKIALELKELGFDEPCFSYFYNKGIFSDTPRENGDDIKYCGDIKFDCHQNSYLEDTDDCSAPLWQQAFDWFLNRGYFADIKPDLIVTNLWSYKVVDINVKYNPENLHYYRFTHYQDARLECLRKLIEIAKEKNVK